MKNFNSVSPSTPEQEKITEVETAWDTLKNEPFKGKQAETPSNSQTNNALPNSSLALEGLRKQVLSSYDTAISREVDFVVDKLRSGEKISIPTQTRQDAYPRGFEKFKRSVLGSNLGSRLFRSKFEKEALGSHRAVVEARKIYGLEVAERAKAERQAKQAKAEQEEKERLASIQAQKEVDARELLEGDLVTASYWAREQTIGRFNKLKLQEEYEKSYNAQLDDIDEIKSLAEIGTEGLSIGDPIQYNGQEIPVIIDDGYPLHFLQSNLAYKIHDEISSDGKIIKNESDSFRTSIARKTMENPELWLQNEEAYEKACLEALERGEDTPSNVMSTSYVNTEIDPRGGVNTSETNIYGVTYLFSHIRPGTLNVAVSMDGHTGSVDRHDVFNKAQYSSLDDIERARKWGGSMEVGYYNEISLYRYNENGEPQPPDALVVRDGKITEYTKKHAAFHHVPIIDIKTYHESE